MNDFARQLRNAYDDGFSAHQNGEPKHLNPYNIDDNYELDLYIEWSEGWRDSQEINSIS